jgi:hypothetical protein
MGLHHKGGLDDALPHNIEAQAQGQRVIDLAIIDWK